ncbi:MAG: type I 3-dehydroquinate dehydratase [Thermodesulfobacteriota bacterium]
MKKKNNPLFSSAPLITAVIVGRIEQRTIKKALVAGADMLEIRVDTFENRGPEDLLRAIKRLKGYEGASRIPLLLTCRARSEGGVHAVAAREKRLIYQALIPFVDCIDIELARVAGYGDVMAQARKAGVGVIISYHDFKATPGAARLSEIIKKGMAAGGDAVKIAATANSRKDILRLTAALLGHRNLIVIAMGPLGKASRVFFPLLGSLTTYGSVTRSSAPGQMPLDELVRAFKTYGIYN